MYTRRGIIQTRQFINPPSAPGALGIHKGGKNDNKGAKREIPYSRRVRYFRATLKEVQQGFACWGAWDPDYGWQAPWTPKEEEEFPDFSSYVSLAALFSEDEEEAV